MIFGMVPRCPQPMARMLFAERSALAPDVIVLDIMMPGGRDGFSACAELQRDPRTQDIAIRMFTEVNRREKS